MSMQPESNVGAAIENGDAEPQRVSEVLINKSEDPDMTITISRDGDGKWIGNLDDAGCVIANSAQELATLLWCDGRCHVGIAEVLYRLGWLKLNHENLKRADESGWRQRDPLG